MPHSAKCSALRPKQILPKPVYTLTSLPFRVMENGIEVAPENLPVQTAAREGISVNSSCRDDGKTVIIINLAAGRAGRCPPRTHRGAPHSGSPLCGEGAVL
jgi:hypothetical protein